MRRGGTRTQPSRYAVAAAHPAVEVVLLIVVVRPVGLPRLCLEILESTLGSLDCRFALLLLLRNLLLVLSDDVIVAFETSERGERTHRAIGWSSAAEHAATSGV